MLLLVIVSLIVGVLASAQEGVPKPKQPDTQHYLPAQEFRLSSNPALTDMPAVGVSDVSCDASGNIYLRSTVPRTRKESTLSLPVIKIARSGRVSQFASNNIEGLTREIAILQYAVGPNGQLYELVQAMVDGKRALFLVEFNGDGQYVSKSRFADSNWVPQTLLPLSSGDFLITGSFVEREKASDVVGGIFGGDARLKRSIAETNPVGALTLGRRDAQLGPDGNIYILRRSSSATVHVISESGDTVRSLTLAPPMPDSSPINAYVGQSRLLVTFQAKQPKEDASPVLYGLYDLRDGTLLRSYFLPPRTGFVTCFSGDEITVLAHRNGYFAIATAEVK